MGIEGIPPKMLACQIVEFAKPHEIREVPTPQSLGEHDLLLKTAVASLCHSDLEYQSGKFAAVKPPITASHEGTGVVVAKGSKVTQFNIGDRVLASHIANRCHDCEDCNGPEAYRHYCTYQAPHMSVGRDGAFAEYLVTDARDSNKIPDELSFTTAAPLACAGVTVWRGVLLTELKPGQWIGIVGSGGGLGYLGVQFAKAKGLKVFAVDARDEGLSLSKECGADVVADAREGMDAVVAAAMKLNGGMGCDATVNVSDAKSAAHTACAITRKHGVMVQIAVAYEVVIPFEQYIFRDIRVKGSLICSQKETKDMMDLVVQHKIKVKTNLFHGIREVPKVVELLRKGAYQGKGVIVIDEEAARTDAGKV